MQNPTLVGRQRLRHDIPGATAGPFGQIVGLLAQLLGAALAISGHIDAHAHGLILLTDHTRDQMLESLEGVTPPANEQTIGILGLDFDFVGVLAPQNLVLDVHPHSLEQPRDDFMNHPLGDRLARDLDLDGPAAQKTQDAAAAAFVDNLVLDLVRCGIETVTSCLESLVEILALDNNGVFGLLLHGSSFLSALRDWPIGPELTSVMISCRAASA